MLQTSAVGITRRLQATHAGRNALHNYSLYRLCTPVKECTLQLQQVVLPFGHAYETLDGQLQYDPLLMMLHTQAQGLMESLPTSLESLQLDSMAFVEVPASSQLSESACFDDAALHLCKSMLLHIGPSLIILKATARCCRDAALRVCPGCGSCASTWDWA